MQVFFEYFGTKGIVITIGIIIFLFSYKYSVAIFNWIEDQTLGTRNYILEKFELMFIQVKSEHITYVLLASSVGSSMLVLGLFIYLGKWPIGLLLGALFFLAGWKSPRPIIDYLFERRVRAYMDQMVDGLQLLANGLRAGLSVPQSLGMVVDELPAPISQEFNLILQQNRIGTPLNECFDNLVKRVPTEDNQMFVTSINILRETGGNLAEVFDTICAVIRERVRLKQKIETLIAQAKFQGAVIFAMPTLILFFYYLQDAQSVEAVFSSNIGILLLIGAYLLNFAGGYFILKVVKIKV